MGWAALLVAVLASPILAAADTIVLRDGRRIETREPYKIEGDQAVLVLTNGTVTTLPLSSIDARKTEEASRLGGSAKVIDGRESRPIQPGQQPRPSSSSLSQVAGQRRLADRRTRQPRPSDNPPTMATQRVQLADDATRGFLSSLYASQGLSAELLESTGPGTATVRLSTDSEAEVFRALVATAVALLQSAEKLENPLAVLELEMRSSDGGQAGDFRITHDRAEALRTQAISPQEFYVRFVEF